ncbi:hypothetical protein ES703_41665 [subsurface metagenome]
MNNREAGRYDPDINNHPPSCTCAECTKRRLGKKQSIWSKAGNYFSPRRAEKPPLSSSEQIVVRRSRKQTSAWLFVTALVFSCSLLGLGITLFIDTAIPLYLLVGFSLIFSIEKWGYYPTRKYAYIGRLYRLFLNLVILCFLGLIIWTGIKLFSQQYFGNQIIGSLVFIAELAFFIWLWRVVAKNSRRWPSMKLTVFVLVIVLLILAFAGVRPFSGYKDTLINKIPNISCSFFGMRQDIDTNVYMFEAKRQPPDISKVVFHVLLEKTDRTVKGADYVISLYIEEKAIDSQTITVSETGSMLGEVSLIANGREMNRMLSDLDEKYNQAQADYTDFQNEMGWDLIRGELGAKSYDEIKMLQEKEEQLQTEINKWKSLRDGNGVNWGDALDVFCKKYVTIKISRQTE